MKSVLILYFSIKIVLKYRTYSKKKIPINIVMDIIIIPTYIHIKIIFYCNLFI